MKTDELEVLVAAMNTQDILFRPEDVILSLQNRGFLKHIFPIPNCAKCVKKCCRPGMGLSLFDVARFIDEGLDSFITGTFEGYLEFLSSGIKGIGTIDGYLEFLSSGSKDIELPIPRIIPPPSGKTDCVFLDGNQRCSIYETRPIICQAFPLILCQDEDGGWLLFWSGSCQSYEIPSDEAASWRLLGKSIQHYNEKLKAVILLAKAREQLVDLGFGKYLGSE